MQAIDRSVKTVESFLAHVIMLAVYLAVCAAVVVLWRVGGSILAFFLTDVPSIHVELKPGANHVSHADLKPAPVHRIGADAAALAPAACASNDLLQQHGAGTACAQCSSRAKRDSTTSCGLAAVSLHNFSLSEVYVHHPEVANLTGHVAHHNASPHRMCSAATHRSYQCRLCLQTKQMQRANGRFTGQQSTTAKAAFPALTLAQANFWAMRTSTLLQRCAHGLRLLVQNALHPALCTAACSSLQICADATVTLRTSAAQAGCAAAPNSLPITATSVPAPNFPTSSVATGGTGGGQCKGSAMPVGEEHNGAAAAAAESAAQAHAAARAHHLPVRRLASV